MDNITELYLNALLSQAAYANGLEPGMTDQDLINKLKIELKDDGLTQAQAEYRQRCYQ
ncbi:hypothetical protein HII17_01880 [Thalassotalea sp. M1531]|uniref:Uncharacterized protein n=1 Tax=Thalassotalea algicola TaxID=2716224 RepID=A0A7Y0LA37_9GAMM|nr:hypothetical protein [Thalassotalea algicola]NMP30297.1 hypothetical protein [Thalassotalea algicola]